MVKIFIRYYKGDKVKALIIGGRGMVGRQLVELCSKVYDKVGVVDKDFNIPNDLPSNAKYYGLDMYLPKNLCRGISEQEQYQD